MKNPNCDHWYCAGPDTEVRILPLPGGANAILCSSCFMHEMNWQRLRNQTLAVDARFPLPLWQDLEKIEP